jgi:uncharacterized protein
MRHPKFVLRKAKNGMYYFVLTAKNGNVIAQSEIFFSKEAAWNGIRLVQESAPIAKIDDQTEEV